MTLKYCKQSTRKKSPESTWVRFHDTKVAELQKTTCKKGHLTLHGPPSNSWGSTAICQDSCMSVFHRCVFRESLPRNETCDDDVWDCGWAFLQVCEWTEPPALNPPSAENNERPASSFWFWRWPLWKCQQVGNSSKRPNKRSGAAVVRALVGRRWSWALLLLCYTHTHSLWHSTSFFLRVMYTCGWFMLIYSRNQHNIVKQLPFY